VQTRMEKSNLKFLASSDSEKLERTSRSVFVTLHPNKENRREELKILKMVMALIFTVNNNSATAPNSVKNTLSLLFLLFQRIDYIYMTGDIIDHGVWNTSIQKNSDIITKVLQQLTTEFPDTPVYPILGNHEPSPLNV